MGEQAEKVADQLKGKVLTTAHVKVFVEKAADGLLDVVEADATATLARRR